MPGVQGPGAADPLAPWETGGTVRPGPGTGLGDLSFSLDPTGPSGKPSASMCPWN